MGCFHNLGVYELKEEGWVFQFKTPYPPTEEDHWIELAAGDEQIALAATPKPRLAGSKVVVDSHAGLWLFDGQKLEKVAFPKN